MNVPSKAKQGVYQGYAIKDYPFAPARHPPSPTTERFDGATLERFEVSEAEKKSALDALDPQTRADTEFAIENVRKFAEVLIQTVVLFCLQASTLLVCPC